MHKEDVLQRFELPEGRVVIRGDPVVIARLWACYHAVVGIPTDALHDGVLTLLFDALADVLATGKVDDDVFVCRAAAMEQVARTALSLWPHSSALQGMEWAAEPDSRARTRIRS